MLKFINSTITLFFCVFINHIEVKIYDISYIYYSNTPPLDQPSEYLTITLKFACDRLSLYNFK